MGGEKKKGCEGRCKEMTRVNRTMIVRPPWNSFIVDMYVCVCACVRARVYAKVSDGTVAF